MDRRTFLASTAAGVASLGIITRRADAAEFVYKFANNQPESHPTNVAATKAAERIREQSGGRLDIQIFPNNQLGSDTDMLSQVRSGALEFYMLSPLRLANIIPTPASAAWASSSRTTTPCGRPWTASWAPSSAPRSPRRGWSPCTRSGTTASATSPPATGRSTVPPISRT